MIVDRCEFRRDGFFQRALNQGGGDTARPDRALPDAEASFNLVSEPTFAVLIAREQWEREGSGWRRTMEAGDRPDRAFVRLVDQRYQAAVAAGPAHAVVEFENPQDSQ
ncbi:hypothetical protein ABZ604_31400 [Streptomyces sp. NPDC012473]|uniref:hypothetical protein n=1 Tax=Streptomyces sp. NPDC012473 TaxID=3156676 RepID=UPI00340FBC63